AHFDRACAVVRGAGEPQVVLAPGGAASAPRDARRDQPALAVGAVHDRRREGAARGVLNERSRVREGRRLLRSCGHAAGRNLLGGGPTSDHAYGRASRGVSTIGSLLPGGGCSTKSLLPFRVIRQPPWCSSPWCQRHSRIPRSMSVRPPSAYSSM